MANTTMTSPIYCTDGEKLAWETAAKQDGRSLNSWVKIQLNAAAIAQGTMLPRPENGQAIPVVGMEGKRNE